MSNLYPRPALPSQVATRVCHDERLTVRLPAELLDEIDALATRRFSKRAETVRHLIVLGVRVEQDRA